MSTFNFDEIKKVTVDQGTSPAQVSPDESKKFVDGVMNRHNMNESQALSAISIICQKGGTSKKAQGNVYAIVDGVRVELNDLRSVFKANNLNFTLRQWARTYATDIQKVTEIFGIEGDLSKKIGRDRPEITYRDRLWLSNFQMDNPNCPANIRTLLMEHYKAMFSGKTNQYQKIYLMY